jgi:very-short-patch-repair endonuclease
VVKSGLARRKRITAICKNCGISFDYSPGHQKNRRFCSKKCQLEFGRTTLYCKQCGIGFNKIKYWAGKQIYCSKKCQTASPEWRAKIREERWNQKFPTKDSLPERILQQFCLELGLDYETDKRISNIKHRYPADLYLSKFNMIIEADGDYWHSWSKKPDHKLKDKYRNKELLEKGYIVLRLKEKDIKKMTKEDFQKKIEEALNRKNKKKQS